MISPNDVISRVVCGTASLCEKPSSETLCILQTYHKPHGAKYDVYTVDNVEVIVCDFDPCRYCVVYKDLDIHYWADLSLHTIVPDEASARWICKEIPMADIKVTQEGGLSVMTMIYNGCVIKVTDDRNPDTALREVKYYIDGKYDAALTKNQKMMYQELN